jgi:capsular exopolysaccharide synthesis family protein
MFPREGHPRGNQSVNYPNNTNPSSDSRIADSFQEIGAIGTLNESDPAQHLLQFLKRRGWLVLALALVGLLVGIIANLILPKYYTAKAKIEILEDKSAQFRLEQSVSAVAGVDSTKLDTEIEILKSQTLALEVIKTLHLNSNPDFLKLQAGRPWDISGPEVRNALIQIFLSRLTVSRSGHTNIIEISVKSPRRELSALIANTLIDAYIEHTFRDNFTATEKIAGWLDQQLSSLKDKLRNSEIHMLQLQSDLGVIGLVQDQTQSVMVANLEELNRDFANAQVDRLIKEARYRTISNAPEKVVDALAGEIPTLQAMKISLSQLNTEYTALIQTYGPAYPRVRVLRAQIDQLESTIKTEDVAQISRAQKELEAAESNEKMLKGMLDSQVREALGHGEKAIQYELARHEYDANRLLYDGLQERLQEAGIIAGLHSSSVRVVDNADIPIGLSHPRVHLNQALGLGIGLVLGFGVAFVFEAMDTNLKTMTEIEHVLQLPLIGVIPKVPSSELLPSTFREHATTAGASNWSRIAEGLRGMRTSILLSSPGSPPKVLMITSSRPSEGKTSIACLAAITLALNGSRTLLIDADLRRPSVHAQFKVAKQTGLSSILSGKIGFREAVVPWMELPNLHILPSGQVPPLPSELLGSKQMERLFEELRGEYDFIVVDTPPVLTVTDASILSRLTDAAVLILRYGAVQQQVVLRCVGLLVRSGAHLLGAVVNAVNFDSPEYADYYGKKYYEYYGERDPE